MAERVSEGAFADWQAALNAPVGDHLSLNDTRRLVSGEMDLFAKAKGVLK